MDAMTLPELDTVLHQPVRTRIAAFLVTREEATFSELKHELEITDGNLDAHLKKMIAENYVKTRKQTGKGRPQTTYSLSAKGTTAFENYIETLKHLLKISRMLS